MNLQRVYAYSVQPSRLSEEGEVSGGKLEGTRELRDALNEAALPLEEEGMPITFVVDPTTRTSEARELCRRASFGAASAAATAANQLATRLGAAMDRRSEPCLFVLAVYGDGETKRLHMWTFPREEAFKFRTGARPAIELLSDIFSRRSRLRKGARFEGRDERTAFLEGRAFDYQASYTAKPIADLWVVRFLGAQLAVTSAAGTRMLADSFRKTFEGADPADKEELFRAAIALRGARQRRWSLAEVGSSYLSEPLRERFLQSAPNEAAKTALFDVDHDAFDTLVGTRVFQLKDGVMVSAPFQEIGRSVRLDEQANHRVLRVQGEIVRERIRRASPKQKHTE